MRKKNYAYLKITMKLCTVCCYSDREPVVLRFLIFILKIICLECYVIYVDYYSKKWKININRIYIQLVCVSIFVCSSIIWHPTLYFKKNISCMTSWKLLWNYIWFPVSLMQRQQFILFFLYSWRYMLRELYHFCRLLFEKIKKKWY